MNEPQSFRFEVGQEDLGDGFATFTMRAQAGTPGHEQPVVMCKIRPSMLALVMPEFRAMLKKATELSVRAAVPEALVTIGEGPLPETDDAPLSTEGAPVNGATVADQCNGLMKALTLTVDRKTRPMSPVEMLERRRMFYAGVSTMQALFRWAAEMDESVAERWLVLWDEETENFAAEMGKGT